MIRNLEELYRYRALLWSLTLRELRARYRGSVLGFLWTFLNPLLLMVVYALIFSVYMRAQIPHYTYFVFIGLLPWIWFSSSVVGGASAISDRRDLLTKVRFPAQVLPATVVMTNLSNYLLALPLVLGLGAAYGVWPSWHLLALPLVVATQLVFTLALSYAISALNVSFRDLQHIVSNLITLWFFLTPVLYSSAIIPVTVRGLPARDLAIYTNPMAILIRSYQNIFYEHSLPEAKPLVAVLAISVLLLMVGAWIFESRRDEFAELV
jgi:lipopolysaccharide transport system permease protein